MIECAPALGTARRCRFGAAGAQLLASVIISLFCLTGCQETSRQFADAADALTSANRVGDAEHTLQEGIRLHPHDAQAGLEGKLLSLYVKSEQWDKVESYLRVVSRVDIEPLRLTNAYESLASRYFDRKEWEKSYDLNMQAANVLSEGWPEGASGTFAQTWRDDAKICWVTTDHVRRYRNAAAAAANMSDIARLQTALDHLSSMDQSAACKVQPPLPPELPERISAIEEVTRWRNKLQAG